ncbi:MAG: peptide ABC transporter substrate-binding protein [Clostridia bacterium]|nr:peptide ABC transporter substrate-binding protein [Clostridia bacterium]
MKKLVSLLLCAVMLMSVASVVAEDKVTYTTLYSSEVTTLNYLVTSSTNEFGIAANLIDTLVEYDLYGRMLPSLALSWENSEDSLTWTFTLRQDANWVDGNGEVVAPVTANDFVASAKYILNAQNASSTANLLYDIIDGAEAYYLGTATPAEGEEPAPVMEWDTVGIKALDDYTLQYTLNHPVPYFLSMLTYVNFMPVYEPFLTEKGDAFGLATGNDTLLYCGAYYMSEFKPQEIRVMSKNATNWDADNVHIDEIVEKYNTESATVSPELYLRGEVDSASLSNELTADWLADEAKAAMIHPSRLTSYYSYFYAFNFDPQFDAAYEPDNWKLAVNNENFRLSIINAFNRIKAKTLLDSENPEMMLYNTITPPTFVEDNGVDYVNIGELAAITAKGADTLDEAAALAYKEAAIAELTEAGATFPVKILLLYNPNASANNSDQEAQIVEQQLEGVLGADYIDVIIESGPATSYLTSRRTGMYGMMNCNWGPDYADPETFTDPFSEGNSYNFMDKAGNPQVEEYLALVNEAKAIVNDISARYAAFAKAEAYLLEHGFVMAFGYGSGGYTASLLDPFSAAIAPFGVTSERFKGQYKLDGYMDTDAYYDAYDAYMAAKDALDAE